MRAQLLRSWRLSHVRPSDQWVWASDVRWHQASEADTRQGLVIHNHQPGLISPRSTEKKISHYWYGHDYVLDYLKSKLNPDKVYSQYTGSTVRYIKFDDSVAADPPTNSLISIGHRNKDQVWCFQTGGWTFFQSMQGRQAGAQETLNMQDKY